MPEPPILRNKSVFRNLRDKSFSEAELLLDDIVSNLERYINADPLMDKISRCLEIVVDLLEDARYYARLSVGGDNVNPPRCVSDEERVYVDLIEMTYSYARSIRRIIRHESAILNQIAMRNNITPHIVDYLLEIRKEDDDLIAKNLQNLHKRLKLYRSFQRLIPIEGN